MANINYYSETVLAGLRNAIGTSFVDGAATVTLKLRLEGDPLVYFSEADQSPPTPCVVIEPADGEFPAVDYDRYPMHAVCNYRGRVFYVEDVANLSAAGAWTQVRRRGEIIAGKIANSANLGLTEPLGTTSGELADFVQYTRVQTGGERELQNFFKESGQRKVARGFSFDVEIWTRKPPTNS